MSDYYVDETLGDDEGTGEIGDPWKSLDSKVSGESYSGDDNISLKKGEEWRETLTIPSSGSEGHQITFGVYGEGADPIINGADIITGWEASEAWATTWSQSPVASSEHTDDYNLRHIIAGATVSGSKIRISLKAGASGATVDGCSIGLRSGSGQDYSAPPTRILFNGGDAFVAIAGDATVVSDDIEMTSFPGGIFDHVVHHLVHIWWDGGFSMAYQANSGNGFYRETGSTGLNDETMVEDTSLPDEKTAWMGCITKIEVYSTTSSYQAACNTEPRQVWYNGIRLTENDGATTGVGANEWDWDANVLYVNVGEDPDEGILEAGARAGGVHAHDKSYYTVDGLEVKYMNGDAGDYTAGIYMYSTASAQSNIIIKNCTVHDCNWVGIGTRSPVWARATDCTIEDNTLYYCSLNEAWSGGIHVLFLNDSMIQRNIVHHDSEHGIRFMSGAGSTIQYNLSYMNGSSGITVCKWEYEDPKPSNNHIRYNICHGNDTIDGLKANMEAIVTDGNYYYYNILYDSQTFGFRTSMSDGDFIYNNVIYNSDVEGFYMYGSANMTLKNNIIMASGTQHMKVINNITGHDIDYNVYGDDGAAKFNWNGTDYNFEDWKTNSGQDEHSIIADPKFVNPGGADFHLEADSPCRDAGIDVGLSEDHDGVSVPQETNPAIGAFEFIGPIHLFEDFKERWGKGVHQFHAGGHTLKIYLTNNPPDAAADAIKADLAGIVEENGYAPADIQNDYTESGGVGTLTGVDVTFEAQGGSFGPFRYAVLYNDTPTSPADPLIGWYDFGSEITCLDTQTFKVDFGTKILDVG